MKNIGIAIHGGAGTILKSNMTPEKETAYKGGLEEALLAGWSVLDKGGSSTDAVTEAVIMLENNILFNAGKGSVFTNAGTQEMDASIMEGRELKAGCVSAVSNIKNPVLLARIIMDRSEHVYLSGKGAEEFAKTMSLGTEPDEYFYSEQRYKQLQNAIKNNTTELDHSDKKFGTVGAVALDVEGNIAAATSTGGMTNKKFGRIGDSPIIGSGTYANNKTCAVSCTGSGEYFIRAVTAYDVSALMEYKGLILQEAADIVVNKKLVALNGDGGLIAIDAECNITMPFNCEGMYRASLRTGSEPEIKIFRE